MRIVYSQTGLGMEAGRTFENPRYYTGPRKGATHVFIEGDWPQITADYAAVGVRVERLDPVTGDGSGMTLPTLTAPRSILPQASAEEKARTFIPDDWRDLPWTGKPDAGLTLRGLAAILADVPVLNKVDAVNAVEAELRRRAEALQASADEG